ncbi:hypothetical protein HYPSUDRAFT_239908 [Hypholoma sublateritium FD-334 SS-4]|uniref:Uncharacterized protein n=1 Tax=Hypholoma sublateritium (strain FD-334 SS-4) TaxID=945553 RepID=A0A0D2PGA0_HYPSF|nr:hypothetical protein HYPSUDRAFT_239908 [Hypholoma sublateritium FD-334 SS-4]
MATSNELDSMKKAFRPPTGQRRKSNHADIYHKVAPALAPTPVHPYYPGVFERTHGSWGTQLNLFDHKSEAELFSSGNHTQQGDDRPILSAPSGSASSTETLISPWLQLKHEEYSDSTALYEHLVEYPQTVDTMARLSFSISPSPPCSPDGFSVPPTPLSVRDPHIQSPHHLISARVSPSFRSLFAFSSSPHL